MSTALTSTSNRLGLRTLSGYRSRDVYRSPAESAPRAASSVQNLRLGAVAQTQPAVLLARPDQPVSHIMPVERVVTIYANGTPSQSPTGSVLDAATYSGQPASVNNPMVLPPTPSAIATIIPDAAAGAPPTISSGGGTSVPANPDYVSEVETWLTSDSLAQSISPSLTLPNWIPTLAAVALVASLMSGSKRR